MKIEEVRGGFLHWCPGCQGAHMIHTNEPNDRTGARWTWDGNREAPTVSPSILVHATAVSPRCHYFLRGGRLEFCGDSAHALAGQVVELPDWPGWGSD